jgi:hypothetical protein
MRTCKGLLLISGINVSSISENIRHRLPIRFTEQVSLAATRQICENIIRGVSRRFYHEFA